LHAAAMRLLLDENVPRVLKSLLDGHEVATVQECGWAGIQNGDLVDKAEGSFDALITADRQLRYSRTWRTDDSRSWSFPPTTARC
jgi:Domain of unknown function (DUF5615)